MTIGDAFERSIAYYDNWVRIALPGYEEIFATAIKLTPFPHDQPIDVLDLGAGTGIFSEHVFSKYLNGRYCLVDLSPGMLAVAKERFRSNQEQFEFVEQDYRVLLLKKRFDLVISSLSIHHLEDGDKLKLFCKVHQQLKDGGLFINIDQIKAPTPNLETLYWETWLAMVRKKGAEEGQIQASIQRRREFDRDVTLIDQLNMLKAAGFVNVDCIYKNYFIGLFFAQRKEE